MTIEDFERNMRVAAYELAELRKKLPQIAQAERSAVGGVMLLDKDGEYLGYVDCFSGEASAE